jgi:hypothetical protein
MVGSSQLSGANAGPTGFEHLVVQGAPEIVRNPARAIDGPAMLPGSRVQALGTVMVNGNLMHWYFVPPDLNIGSAFAHHLVLVWTSTGHTYAYGFHDVDGIAKARTRDLQLARHLVMIRPRALH